MAQEGKGGLTGQRLGGYELRSVLGVGGMAEVYRARDVTPLGRDVAVKVLPAALATDPGYVQRFRIEARRVAALNHPHVIPIYTYGEERGLLFLVMPILKESLRDRLEREHQLPINDAIKLAAQVASGLEAAHEIGLVHRDVKPENVLLDAGGKAMLTDFGIARDVRFARNTGVIPTLAATGLPVGTPEYMAPEQLRGKKVDQRADIYALGAVLYEMLTGKVPHEAASPYETAAQVLTASPTPPSKRNPAIWPALERVILRAMAKNPDDRYLDATSFAAALRLAARERARPAVAAVDDKETLLTPMLEDSAGSAGPRARTRGGRKTRTLNWPDTSLDAPLDAPTDSRMAISGYDAAITAPPATWRERLPAPAGLGRKWLVLGAAVLLLFICACGVFARGAFQGPSGLPTGDGLAGTIASPTPTDTATVAIIPTASAVPSATIGVIVTVTPTPTATATATPTPTATAVPPPLTFSSINLAISSYYCIGTQTITNTSAQAVQWSWQPTSQLSSFYYYLNGKYQGTGYPYDATAGRIPPGQTDKVLVKFLNYSGQHNCPTQPVTVSAYDLPPDSQNYTFTIYPPGA